MYIYLFFKDLFGGGGRGRGKGERVLSRLPAEYRACLKGLNPWTLRSQPGLNPRVGHSTNCMPRHP